MMLRTRILLIATMIVMLVIGLFTYGAWLREQIGRDRHDALRLATLALGWTAHGPAAIERASAVLLARLEASGALDALAARDTMRLAILQSTLLGRGIDGVRLMRVDLHADDGTLLFSTDYGYLTRYLLGEGEPLPLQAEEPLIGTRIGDGTLRGIALAPLWREAAAPAGQTGRNDKDRLGTMVLVVDLAPAIEAMARENDALILVLDRAGNPVRSTGGAIEALLPQGELSALVAGFDFTEPAITERPAGNGRFELANVLAVDVGGGRSATLAVVRDIAREAEQRRFTALAWLLGVCLVGLVPLGILWVYLRGTFEPLDEAVEAVRELASGHTDHYAELRGGEDEIGHIGRAVEVFRQNALALERNADIEERRRRRQARFIRRQMTTLSETLAEEAQASALEDLRQIEAASAADAGEAGDGGTRFSDQLGLIGVALERMTARVRSQQQALSELIDELREALEMKTRLISLEQELDIARQMQQNILPRTFPDTPGFEIAAVMRPAREVGGDFYDIFQVDTHRVGVAIADVSGKGIPAAFFMLISRTLLKAIALEGAGPGKTLARLNEFLCGDNEETMFVTLFYGELDIRNGRFTYANGGHNHPFLGHPDGAVAPLETTDGMALAVFDQLSFAERRIELGPGQTLTLYTDGVTEAVDTKENLYGEERLARLLAGVGDGSAERILATVLASIEAFCGTAPQFDDITLIVMASREREGAPAGGARLGGHDATEPHAAPGMGFAMTLRNDIGEHRRLGEAFVGFLGTHGFDESAVVPFEIAFDEVLTNICRYAWDDGEQHVIEVTAGLAPDGTVTVTFVDDGMPFDPLAAASPDLDADLEERAIGGLGIHLVRELMDEVRYAREGEINRLTLVKQLGADDEEETT